jgi:hypothetical protein
MLPQGMPDLPEITALDVTLNSNPLTDLCVERPCFCLYLEGWEWGGTVTIRPFVLCYTKSKLIIS